MRRVPVILLLLFTGCLSAQTKADDIDGIWLTSGKEPAKIQVFKYYGKITWLKFDLENGKSRTDKNNPDQLKPTLQIIAIIVDDEWEGGNISVPESGKTYSYFMSLKNSNTLKVRGYIGISLLGRTETWTRSSL